LICKMSPTLPQIMESFEVENNEAFEARLCKFASCNQSQE
ncbi:jg15481, partial [Pararge aegeria aegeria]